jgi:hypothetical protein
VFSVMSTTAGYVVDDSSTIVIACYPLSQFNSQGQVNSHRAGGGTSRGDSNSAYAMSWHAHVLAASSGAAVGGSKGLSTAHHTTEQSVPGSVMPLAPSVTFLGFTNSTSLQLSATAGTAEVHVKARESACCAPLLPNCHAGDSTCTAVVPTAAASQPWWLPQCDKAETACVAVPAASSAAVWWLQQCDKGESVCSVGDTTAAMWWQQQREGIVANTSSLAAAPTARIAPTAALALQVRTCT